MTSGDDPAGSPVTDPDDGFPETGPPSGKVSDGRERTYGSRMTRTTGTMAAVVASASGTAPAADPKGVHGFLGRPISPLLRIRRSTVLMAALFVGLGALSLTFPPLDTTGTSTRSPASQAPAPTVVPVTTTTTTAAPPATTTTTTRPTSGSTTTTTRPTSGSTTTTTRPTSGSTTTTTRPTSGAVAGGAGG